MIVQSRARHTLPYAHLNLRRNPFGEMGRKERSEVAVADVEDLVERLRKPGFAVQFMGNHGCGKTSHMLAILKHYPDAVFVHVHERERPSIPGGHPLFIDDVQFISRRRRAGVFRRKASFILGTHQDMSVELRKAGLETKTVYPGEAMCKERLHLIFHRRIENVRRGPGPLPCVPMSEIRILMDRFGGDVRAMEHFLYDIFQTLKEVQDVSL